MGLSWQSGDNAATASGPHDSTFASTTGRLGAGVGVLRAVAVVGGAGAGEEEGDAGFEDSGLGASAGGADFVTVGLAGVDEADGLEDAEVRLEGAVMVAYATGCSGAAGGARAFLRAETIAKRTIPYSTTDTPPTAIIGGEIQTLVGSRLIKAG